ncbi:alpha/beta hydrolase [Entomobacter blattae]|uniref:Serine aminopeptidase, S33 n=1 Tax=Entomobacter blattae TaxID=2762277 RepID=A0A7H1NQF8_9PROT|nr:alpha/beta hydrolase [Entomobacter blattae]QNT78018.1 Serine aminopeptidase, S33 [Entomobacter blattae]
MEMEQLHHPKIRGKDMTLNIRTMRGQPPTLVFLHGLASSLESTKGNFLLDVAMKYKLGILRMDYRGHGMSDGNFTECTLTDWKEDTLLGIDNFTEGPLLFVGSSIGVWVGLLAALERPERIMGFVGIAAAVDVTRHLYQTLSSFEKEALDQTGLCKTYSNHADPITITQRLMDSGQNNLLMDKPIPLHCPVRLLHGEKDTDVPYSYSLELSKALESEDVHTILIKDGEHRLSREQDLALLEQTIEMMVKNYHKNTPLTKPVDRISYF